MVCILLAATAQGCSRPANGAQPVVENNAAKQFATQLRDRVTAEAMTVPPNVANMSGAQKAEVH